ncbi:hypothetical protein Pmani_019606 [Petrolisthes manimaculis]|uniref:Uncharacterized protein n=1 Tax=Petrolisthes manimaculis TaxID=1843537 RepID=A0AAE1PHC6_9EUCA|nr:hypothetical protein Pmani_019606 [Petrolisthes manimaculis]
MAMSEQSRGQGQTKGWGHGVTTSSSCVPVCSRQPAHCVRNVSTRLDLVPHRSSTPPPDAATTTTLEGPHGTRTKHGVIIKINHLAAIVLNVAAIVLNVAAIVL